MRKCTHGHLWSSTCIAYQTQWYPNSMATVKWSNKGSLPIQILLATYVILNLIWNKWVRIAQACRKPLEEITEVYKCRRDIQDFSGGWGGGGGGGGGVNNFFWGGGVVGGGEVGGGLGHDSLWSNSPALYTRMRAVWIQYFLYPQPHSCIFSWFYYVNKKHRTRKCVHYLFKLIATPRLCQACLLVSDKCAGRHVTHKPTWRDL